MFVIVCMQQGDRRISFAFWCTVGEWDKIRKLVTGSAQFVWTSFRSHAISRNVERPDLPTSVWRVDVDPGEWTESVMQRYGTILLEPSMEEAFLEDLI